MTKLTGQAAFDALAECDIICDCLDLFEHLDFSSAAVRSAFIEKTRTVTKWELDYLYQQVHEYAERYEDLRATFN